MKRLQDVAIRRLKTLLLVVLCLLGRSIFVDSSAVGSDCVRWIWRSDVGAPPLRSGHTMAYDTDREITVLFGGFREDNYFNDTWEYDGIRWQPVAIEGPSPDPRAFTAMCYDSWRKEMVLAGGYNPDISENDGYLADTWVFESLAPGRGKWIRKIDIPARFAAMFKRPMYGIAGHAMVFDTRNGESCLTGGTLGEDSKISPGDYDRSSRILFRDANTWYYRSSNFETVSLLFKRNNPKGIWEGPVGHAMVYHSDTGSILMGPGGYNYVTRGKVTPINDQVEIRRWDYQDADTDTFLRVAYWRRNNVSSEIEFIVEPSSPKPYLSGVGGYPIGGSRRNYAAAYDLHRKQVVVFGGMIGDETPLPGTKDPGDSHSEYQYTINANGQEEPRASNASRTTRLGNPPAREGHAMVYDIKRQRTVLFGGSRNFKDFYADTWEYGFGAIPIIYVDSRNQGHQDGTIYNPYTTIRQAIAASSVECPTIISVQSGIYREGYFSTTKPVRITARNGLVRFK